MSWPSHLLTFYLNMKTCLYLFIFNPNLSVPSTEAWLKSGLIEWYCVSHIHQSFNLITCMCYMLLCMWKFLPTVLRSEELVTFCSGKLTVYIRVLSHFSCVQLFETQWTVVHKAPLSMGFSRQEYWSGFPCPPLGDLPDPGTEPVSLMSPALAGRFFTTSPTWEALLFP